MSRIDHSIDWKGFGFSLKVGALCLLIGASGHYGLLYATSYFVSPHAELVAVAPEPEPVVAAVALSSSTPQRVINRLTIADAVPKDGTFIAADLVNMRLFLYQDGTTTAEYPILTKGRPGTPWETPSGFYAVQTKEESHFSTIGHVYMPYSMQFYGNYFIHGWTYYPDGTPVSASFSGGCIKLSTEDAQKVFEFATVGTKVFVYDATAAPKQEPLSLNVASQPALGASAYLIADLDTGDVYAEHDAQVQRPIASVTKLMTALVANETISLTKTVTVPEGALQNPPEPASSTPKSFLVDDLFYPLLMQSSNMVADSLASYYGKRGFIGWMNATARALDMASTTFADPSGVSSENISTPDDLYRLAVYLANKKSFVLKITQTKQKTITAEDGSRYTIQNLNTPADASPFEGGKVGHTTAAGDTMLSILSVPVGGAERRVAIIVLQSDDRIADVTSLAQWFTRSVAPAGANSACAACAEEPQYRKIEP